MIMPRPRAHMVVAMVLIALALGLVYPAQAGMGVNWGTQSSHPLSPSVVVELLKDNDITKVKLFDAKESTLKALVGSDIEVMVAIPNNMLEQMADADSGSADSWVEHNVARYTFEGGVTIKYVFMFPVSHRFQIRTCIMKISCRLM